jgi:hypothetical protein
MWIDICVWVEGARKIYGIEEKFSEDWKIAPKGVKFTKIPQTFISGSCDSWKLSLSNSIVKI